MHACPECYCQCDCDGDDTYMDPPDICYCGCDNEDDEEYHDDSPEPQHD